MSMARFKRPRLSVLLGTSVFVLAIALLCFMIYSIFFGYAEDTDAETRQTMLRIYNALDQAPVEARPAFAESLSQIVLKVEYVPQTEPLANPINRRIAELQINNLPLRVGANTKSQLSLPDGNVIRMSHQLVDWRDRPSLWIALGILFLLLLLAALLWAITRYLSPVQQVVQAANQLSLDRELTPIDETSGPALARGAASAFNRMQARIREFLGERSLMIHALHHDMRHGIFKLQMRLENSADDTLKEKGASDLNDLLEVLDEVLAFADTDVGPDRLQSIRVNSIVFGAIDSWVDQGREIETDLKRPFGVLANQTRLKRSIGNLVNNAMLYATRLWITGEGDEHEYRLTFDDDGPGIPEAERERLFQPFQRLETSRNRDTGGTGLGLAIVKRGIERDGGSVTLADSPRGGLRVEVVLKRPEAP